LGALLVLLKSPQGIKSHIFYFTIFRARVWKISILERILFLEIQTNCKNWVWKENLVEPSMCSYLGANGIGYTSLFMKQKIKINKIYIYIYSFSGPCSTWTGTITFDPTFVIFTLLKPISH
jgi:hypothetical protein